MCKKIFPIILLILFNCKSISISNETQIKTSKTLELGVIGEDKVFLLEQDYNSIALPKYNEPIKVSANYLSFNKPSFKAFSEANNKKTKPLKLEYIDSLVKKPKFLKLELLDRVAVLIALNSLTNEDVKNYILNKKEAHIISAISITLDDEKMKSIADSDALFLEQDGEKKYLLRGYLEGQLKMSICFNEGVVFAYQASSFCWQENDKHQLDIVDIVESTDKCPNNSYKSAKRAKKKVDYFKF